MLTDHNYKPSKKDIGEGSKIFYCCSSGSDDPGCEECCYDNWSDELKEVSSRYTQAVEDALQLQGRLSIVTDKRNRYKKWVEELILAEEKAKSISDQLEIIASQSEKIWYNACKASEAIEILFCMIRDFYYQVDEIKKRYDLLWNCINNNTDPALVKDQGILKCLGEYYKKLEDIIKTRDVLIKDIIEAIKLAQLLRNNISTRGCPCDDGYDPCKPGKVCDCGRCGEFYGFKAIICDWYCEFLCVDGDGKPCGDDEDEKTGNQTSQTNQANQNAPATNGDPCKSEICELKPYFDMPLCKNGKYREMIEKLFTSSNDCVTILIDQLKDKNKEKEALEACKKSLENAIKEVNPRDRCK